MILRVAAVSLLCPLLLGAVVPAATAVDFNADVQPILADACFRCHGPDESQREAELRLDEPPSDVLREQLLTGGGELLRRIRADDPDVRMPPADAARQLTPAEIKTLSDWIASGAAWGKHWAFAPPRKTPLPEVEFEGWSRSSIDRFVGATLQRKGWRPSPRATRETLIRRASLDLIGLPPSLAEVEAFLADPDDDRTAYAKVVNRLLQSPRYGERMASMWLDAARYADTSGYQNDGPRDMWRYRDWVINAFNQNMPFDRFTMLQIAGDLLVADPEETPPHGYDTAWRGELITDPDRLAGLIPSAFHRNHRGNAEGGIIAEEFQAEYVVDRVDTTATVWLGLTLGCCRCHDHKYDPFQQREFYELFAFFNNIPEYGRAIKEGNSPPFIKAPTKRQRKAWRSLKQSADRARRDFDRLLRSEAYRTAFQEFLADPDAISIGDPIVERGLVSRLTWDQAAVDGAWNDEACGSRRWRREGSGGALVAGNNHQAGEEQAWQGNGEGWLAAAFNGSEDETDFTYTDAFTISAWVAPAGRTGTVVSRMTLGPEQDGYYLHLEDGKVQLNLVKRWLDDSLRVETAAELPADQWTHVAAVYDGSRYWQGVQIYFDGVPQPLEVRQDFINQTFTAAGQPLRIGHGAARFVGRLNDVRIYRRALTRDEVGIVAEPQGVSALAAQAPESNKLVASFHRFAAPAWIQRIARRAAGAAERLTQFENALPTLMVMQELGERRDTHVLLRGQHDQPGEAVQPNVPRRLHPFPKSAPRDRRGLARWLVDPDNPLTARVLVNRLWQLHFGMGVVETAEDFGIQGARPTHPRLLDWLAVQFMESGWDIKALQRQILLSETFCQSSSGDAAQVARDPDNRWLARGPRYRLPAEIVRDQALAASGLLKHRLGGPSVRPYQPQGLWKEIATDTNYEQSHGNDLYRRSLYTYWKRTVAPPTMMTLDAVSREACVVQRARTNTPLQALALMNEVSFVEAARMLAARGMRAAHSPNAQIDAMFRLAVVRRPTAAERRVLKHAFQKHLARFQHDLAEAERLLSEGESPHDSQLDPAQWAAMTLVASTILNLDETLTKQ